MATEKTGDEQKRISLRDPFPAHQISKLPNGTKAQNMCPANEKRNCQICGGWHHPQVKHLDYVGHAALTDRLLDVDPGWYWEPLALENGLPAFDKSGGLWIRLTVNGITRIGYGNAETKAHMDVGAREKEVIGDALRNAAMRFGAALDLWHKGVLHVDAEPDEPPTANITDDPIDTDKVFKASVWFREMIDADQIEENYKKIQHAWEKLNTNEQMEVHKQLGEKAPGAKKLYRNLLKEYLAYAPAQGVQLDDAQDEDLARVAG